MKEYPILFSTPMVKAILSGNKTMTRRVAKTEIRLAPSLCKYQIGDRLWVKETFAIGDAYYYKADEVDGVLKYKGKWKPSIFMPRRASRITLEVVNVRCERLQDLTTEDAKSEGITEYLMDFDGLLHTEDEIDRWRNRTSIENFKVLWESINGKESWDKNPFVWVIEFKRISNEM